MRPGPRNSITDVAGIRVGHTTRDEDGWLTGCTAVVPPPGTVAGVDVRGGGPGTRETDLLDPRNAVDTVDAVVLSGGSAFGLASADGVAAAVYAAGLGWPVGPGEQRVPIVPAAILFDLGRGGTWLHHPAAQDGRAAYESATEGPVPQGNVGAGTGAKAGGLRGGLGTASVVLESGMTMAAVVAVNAMGSPVASDGRLYAASVMTPEELAGSERPDPEAVARYWHGIEDELAAMRAGMATTIGVIATDATLTKAQCQKLAGTGHDGMARAISPVHTAYDGDALFALATGARPAPGPWEIVELQAAAGDVVTRAIGNALLAAESVDRSAVGGVLLRSWRDAMTAGPAVDRSDLAPDPLLTPRTQ